MIVRRRRMPSQLAGPARAFDELVPVLERAKAELTEAVPGTRVPGRPLAEALAAFEAGLAEARERMPRWRAVAVDDRWRACSAALDEALARAERLRVTGDAPEGFEGLVGLVGELLEPLEAFRDAAARFRELRR